MKILANHMGLHSWARVVTAFCLIGTGLVISGAPQPVAAGTTGPSFSKVFAPNTIGPNSTTTLTFTIDNTTGVSAGDLAFADVLPAGMIIATPSGVSTTCGPWASVGPTLSAPDGGTTISLSDASVAGSSICTVSVNVTAIADDASDTTYTNTSGDLTSSVGNSGTATDDLTVDVGRPGFTKSFAPSTIDLGERSELTFTIDNSLNGSGSSNLDFTDVLPAGMVIADPANASTDCGTAILPPDLTAPAGTDTITLDANGTSGFPAVAAGATCTVTVDVIGTAAGSLNNVSGDLTVLDDQFTSVSSGFATAVLEVEQGPLHIAKDFTDDPIPPGGVATLQITISNGDRADTATSVAFTDTLPTGVTLATPANASSDCGGTLTAVDSGAEISLTGGTIAAAARCTTTVSVTAPANGEYQNVTGSVTGTVGGNGVEGNSATETLFVTPAPILTKEFTDDPVGAGGTATLEFTITNTSPDSEMTDITFDDVFDSILPTSPGLAPGFCGPSSTATFVPAFDGSGGSSNTPASLTISGASLAAAGAPGDSCTFSITLDVRPSAGAGTYPNTTSEITGTIDTCNEGCFEPVIGPPASDDLVVVGAPQLTKEFIDDPVATGGTTTLQFTLTHHASAPGDATDIGFTDDLAALVPAIAGLTATLPPVPDPPCGVGSSLTASAGDTLLTFAGGTLAPGTECTFSVTLNIPADAPTGSTTNTTSDVTATVSSVAVTGNPASDDLLVTGLLFTKEFIDDPAIAGGTATLRFTLDNTTGSEDATGIFFTDTLTSNLPGLTATVPPVPDPPCGAGSTLTGTTTLTFVGGTVPAGTSCAFDVTVSVPLGTPDGVYANITSGLTATIGASAAFLPPATDGLTVQSGILALTKEFTDDPVAPGGEVTLEFTLTNLSATETVTDIEFDDDLDAALTGLTATGATGNTCGGMAAGFPTGLFDYSGGSLAPAASCTITLTVEVPVGTPLGGAFTNTTSPVTGKVGALDVGGDAASDDLVVQTLDFSKSFDGPTTATGTAVLSFTITNLDSSNSASLLAFTDDLNATLAGLAAVGLPAANVCGAGSEVAGTSFVSLTGASLAPDASCSFDVTVLVPGDATPGTYLNTTSILTSGGLRAAIPATADLTIEPPPTFAKSFAPTSIASTTTSTLTFTIDNAASALAATALAFTDALPAGLAVATPPNAGTTCTGGTLTAVAGSGTLSYAGGSVAAGAACSLTVDVTAASSGSFVNTSGDLTSSSGNSGPATATLTVTGAEADISVTKTDGVTSAVPGKDTIVYTIVVANAGPSTAPAVAVADVFPADLTCSWTSTSSGCATGGAASGSGNLTETLAMPAGSSTTYTTSCAIDPAATGTLSNTATVAFDAGGAVTQRLIEADAPSISDPAPANNSASDSDTELTPQVDISVTKTDGVTAANSGVDTLSYTIVVTNSGSSVDPAVAVTDNFPAALTCTWTSTVSGGATGNSASGSGNITQTLSMPPGSNVTYQANCSIQSTASGTLTNTATAIASVTDTDQTNNTATDSDTTLTAQAPTPTIPATGGDASALLRQALLAVIVGLGLVVVARTSRRRASAR